MRPARFAYTYAHTCRLRLGDEHLQSSQAQAIENLGALHDVQIHDSHLRERGRKGSSATKGSNVVSTHHDPEGLFVEGPGIPVVREAGQKGLFLHGGRS